MSPSYFEVYPEDLHVVRTTRKVKNARGFQMVRTTWESSAPSHLVTRIPEKLRAIGVEGLVFRARLNRRTYLVDIWVMDGKWTKIWSCNEDFFKAHFVKDTSA